MTISERVLKGNCPQQVPVRRVLQIAYARSYGSIAGTSKRGHSDAVVRHTVVDVEAIGRLRSSRRSTPVGNTTLSTVPCFIGMRPPNE